MSRRALRDRNAEQATIRAAADRLLAGIPLHSTTGKLTTTELITESGLRRDTVYEHRHLVEEFKARVKAQHSTPSGMQQLSDEHAITKRELASVKEELTKERAMNSVLRRIIAELSLEQEQAKEDLTQSPRVIRLHTRPPS